MDNNEQIQTKQQEPIELTEMFVQKRQTVTIADTITLQAILCVAISIAYIVINMLLPQNAVEIYDTYNYNIHMQMEQDPISSVIKFVTDFVNSTPVTYD